MPAINEWFYSFRRSDTVDDLSVWLSGRDYTSSHHGPQLYDKRGFPMIALRKGHHRRGIVLVLETPKMAEVLKAVWDNQTVMKVA